MVFKNEKEFYSDRRVAVHTSNRQHTQNLRSTCLCRLHGGGQIWIHQCIWTCSKWIDKIFKSALRQLEFPARQCPDPQCNSYYKVLQIQKIPLLEWPSKSPDLNIIEDLWRILSASVFKSEQLFIPVKELKREWKMENLKDPVYSYYVM